MKEMTLTEIKEHETDWGELRKVQFMADRLIYAVNEVPYDARTGAPLQKYRDKKRVALAVELGELLQEVPSVFKYWKRSVAAPLIPTESIEQMIETKGRYLTHSAAKYVAHEKDNGKDEPVFWLRQDSQKYCHALYELADVIIFALSTDNDVYPLSDGMVELYTPETETAEERDNRLTRLVRSLFGRASNYPDLPVTPLAVSIGRALGFNDWDMESAVRIKIRENIRRAVDAQLMKLCREDNLRMSSAVVSSKASIVEMVLIDVWEQYGGHVVEWQGTDDPSTFALFLMHLRVGLLDTIEILHDGGLPSQAHVATLRSLDRLESVGIEL